jgi:hypothetical protein
MSEFPFFNGHPAELEKLPKWRKRIDWLRRAAHAQHSRVLERGSISCYGYAELEHLERAGRERSRRRRWDEGKIIGSDQEQGNACVQRYLTAIRKTAERDLGVRTLAPAVHVLVQGEGYMLPSFTPATQPPAPRGPQASSIYAYLGGLDGATAGREVWYRLRGALRADEYQRALRDAMESLRW